MDGVQFGDNRKIFSKLGKLACFSITFLEFLLFFGYFYYVCLRPMSFKLELGAGGDVILA